MTTEPTEIGHRLRALALRRGWDMRALASEAGVSPTTLYNIETGETARPQAATLRKLAEALEVSIAQLVDDVPADPAASTDDAAFDRAGNPAVDDVRQSQPELFAGWSDDEWDELYSTYGVGGGLNERAVVDTAAHINRKREIVRQLHVVLETHLGDAAAEVVAALYRLVRPPK